MKKLMFLFVSLLTLTMTSCGDDDEEKDEPIINPFHACNPAFTYFSAEGGSVDIKWEAAKVPTVYEFYSASWFVKEGHEAEYKKYVDGDDTTLLKWDEIFGFSSWPGEKMETSIDGNVISGEWFTAEYIDNPKYVLGEHPEIKVTLSPNTTGARRYLRIYPPAPNISDAYIFQDCEEPEE